MNNAATAAKETTMSIYEITPCAEYGLYQVVNTQSAMRTRPWPLPRCERILRDLRSTEEKMAAYTARRRAR